MSGREWRPQPFESKFTSAALAESFGPRHSWQVRPGEVWRASAGDVRVLVLVLRVSGSEVTAVPVTIDDTFAADRCFVVPPAESDFSSDVIVWASLERQIPLLALDRPIGHMPRVGRALNDDTAMPANVSPGRSGNDGLDEEAAAELDDQLKQLIDGTRLSATADSDVATASRVTPQASQIEELVARTSLPLPEILDMIDGAVEIPEAKTELFLDVFGSLPAARRIPRELADVVTHPRNRSSVIFLANRAQTPTVSAAQALCQEILDVAARQSMRNSPDWQGRLDRWAEVKGVPDLP